MTDLKTLAKRAMEAGQFEAGGDYYDDGGGLIQTEEYIEFEEAATAEAIYNLCVERDRLREAVNRVLNKEFSGEIEKLPVYFHNELMEALKEKDDVAK